MKVQDVMTRSPLTCFIQDPLHLAAQKLWERDCGCLPVVDSDQRPIAMITDRDICMAAFTTGKPLHELQVGQAMSKEVVTCREGDDVATAGTRMAQANVRRVPVVDARGVLCGVLSLNDLAVRTAKEGNPRSGGVPGETMRVLCAVSRHRDEAGERDGAQAAAPAPGQSQGAGQSTGQSAAAKPASQAGTQPQRNDGRPPQPANVPNVPPSRMASSSGESSASATA
jgi:CBS domain-containing protein